MVERPDELESERIQQDIERTRQQMSGTIDEIQERLTPSRLLHEATASVREAGAGSVRRVLSHAGRAAGRTAGQARAASAAAAGYARSHPLPAAWRCWPGPRAGRTFSPAAEPVHHERRGVQRMGRSPRRACAAQRSTRAPRIPRLGRAERCRPPHHLVQHELDRGELAGSRRRGRGRRHSGGHDVGEPAAPVARRRRNETVRR